MEKYFKPGDKVIAVSGAWHGMKGTVISYNKGERNFELKVTFDPAGQYKVGECLDLFVKGWIIDESVDKSNGITAGIKPEGPCQVCKRINDLDKKSCWWCLNIPFERIK